VTKRTYQDSYQKTLLNHIKNVPLKPH